MFRAFIKWFNNIVVLCQYGIRIRWPWLGRFHLLKFTIFHTVISTITFVVVNNGFEATPSQNIPIGPIGLTAFAIALLFTFGWLLAVEHTRTELPRSHANCANLTLSMVLIAAGLLTSGYAGVCAAERRERAVVDRITLFRDASAVGAVIDRDGRSKIGLPVAKPPLTQWDILDKTACSALTRDRVEFERVVAHYDRPLDSRVMLVLSKSCNDEKSTGKPALQLQDTWKRVIQLAISNQEHEQIPSISRQPLFATLALAGALFGVIILALLSSVGSLIAFGSALTMFSICIALQLVVPQSVIAQTTLQIKIPMWCGLTAIVGFIAVVCMQRLRRHRSVHSDIMLACMLWLPGVGCWLFLFSKGIAVNSFWRMDPWTTWHGLPVPQDDAHRGCFFMAIGFFLFSPFLNWLLEQYRRLPFIR